MKTIVCSAAIVLLFVSVASANVGPRADLMHRAEQVAGHTADQSVIRLSKNSELVCDKHNRSLCRR